MKCNGFVDSSCFGESSKFIPQKHNECLLRALPSAKTGQESWDLGHGLRLYRNPILFRHAVSSKQVEYAVYGTIVTPNYGNHMDISLEQEVKSKPKANRKKTTTTKLPTNRS